MGSGSGHQDENQEQIGSVATGASGDDQPTIAPVSFSGHNWEVRVGDCLDVMKSMPDNAVSVSITSPPYEDARLYGELNFKVRGQEWVDWCIPRVLEMCRVTDGLVFFNAVGKRRNWMYSPVIEWLVSDLTRNHGIVCGPAPYVFHRIGVPGSGSRKYHRRDWEPIYCFAMPKKVPPKFTDNTAMGHPPKWAPGGEMSNRNADGSRRNQWGHSIDSGGTVVESGGVIRSKGKRPSHVQVGSRDQWGGTGHASSGEGRKTDGDFKTPLSFGEKIAAGAKLHTKCDAGTGKDGAALREQAYMPPVLADPGNVLFLKVGGGLMGHKAAHENEAPFPLKLAEFFVRSYCPPGGIAFDPFCGSGTVLHAAAIHGRHGLGVDARLNQAELTHRRMLTIPKSLFDNEASQ